MRILIFDTGRGISAAKVALWREQLALEPGDEVALLSWQAPAEPLPLRAHLVCGPALQLGREARQHPTADRSAQAEPALVAGELSEQFADADELAATEGGPSSASGSERHSERLAERLAERHGARRSDRKERHLVDAGGSPADEETATAAPETLDAQDVAEVVEAAALLDATGLGSPRDLPPLADGLPAGTLAVSGSPDAQAGSDDAVEADLGPVGADSIDPDSVPAAPSGVSGERLRAAAQWRVNRVRRALRLRRQRGLSTIRDLPSAAVRSTLRLRGDGIANEFALAASTSKAAAALFTGADVVVPVDVRSQRAAWLLARRYEGPDVIITFQAAARRIALRRAEKAAEPSSR